MSSPVANLVLFVLAAFCVVILALLARMYAEIGTVHRRIDIMLHKNGAWHQKVDRMHEDLRNLHHAEKEQQDDLVVELESKQILDTLNELGYGTKKMVRR